MPKANQRKRLLKFIHEIPYFVMVASDKKGNTALIAALGRKPDSYASYQGGYIVAIYHYTSLADVIDAARKVPVNQPITVADARVQAALPPTGQHQDEQRAARDLT